MHLSLNCRQVCGQFKGDNDKSFNLVSSESSLYHSCQPTSPFFKVKSLCPQIVDNSLLKFLQISCVWFPFYYKSCKNNDLCSSSNDRCSSSNVRCSSSIVSQFLLSVVHLAFQLLQHFMLQVWHCYVQLHRNPFLSCSLSIHPVPISCESFFVLISSENSVCESPYTPLNIFLIKKHRSASTMTT